MLLGSKPISEMSDEELRAAIAELQSAREALRNEAIKEKREKEAKGDTTAVKTPRTRAPKAAKVEKDPMLAGILEGLFGDTK